MPTATSQSALLAVLPLAAATLKLKQQQDPTSRAWRAMARPDQRPPDGDWRTWYIRGGRGGGKTWTGAHTLAEMAQEMPGEYAVVAPTFADARDTCVEGAKSGLLAALGTNRGEVDRGASRLVRSWNRSMGDLRLRNGSVIWAGAADDGALRVQGKNLNALWADEVGLWKRWRTAWEESIRYAVRLSPARIIATGTPKRGHPLVKMLMDDEAIPKTLLRTMDNAENLDPGLLEELVRQYGGTTLGRQELEGEIVPDAERALWKRHHIRHVGDVDVPGMPVMYRDGILRPDLRRVVVAIDPSASSDATSDECGIVAAGVDREGRGWVLEDVSAVMSPAEWARAGDRLAEKHGADTIVAEKNNGGEMVGLTLRTVSNRRVKLVSASQSKQARAEPILGQYEQGRVIHAEHFPELEDQMCTWEPDTGAPSPDRLDALVWALTELMLGKGWATVSAGEAGGVV